MAPPCSTFSRPREVNFKQHCHEGDTVRPDTPRAMRDARNGFGITNASPEEEAKLLRDNQVAEFTGRVFVVLRQEHPLRGGEPTQQLAMGVAELPHIFPKSTTCSRVVSAVHVRRCTRLDDQNAL